VGIQALLAGLADVAMSSRDLTPQEREQLSARGAFVEQVIALDALAFIVHPSNPVNRLTVQQISDMYSGNITNWQLLTGQRQPISVFAREASSGTYEYVHHGILKPLPLTPYAIQQTSNGGVVQSVAHNPAAIGYSALAYLNAGVKAVSVSVDGGKTYHAPSVAAARQGVYPLSRPLYLVFFRSAEPRLAPFLAYLRSPAAERLVLAVGYVPPLPTRASR
jgi:phosphate transport system substrate-binding protein